MFVGGRACACRTGRGRRIPWGHSWLLIGLAGVRDGVGVYRRRHPFGASRSPTPTPTGHDQPMRQLPLIACALLLAACTSTTDPQASPSPTPTTASPTPAPSYDPAHKTSFITEPSASITEDRTYTFAVGGTGPGERLRPGWWHTAGGPCGFVAPDKKGDAYEVGGGGYAPLPVTVQLPEGATFVVVHHALMSGLGCTWSWEGELN